MSSSNVLLPKGAANEQGTSALSLQKAPPPRPPRLPSATLAILSWTFCSASLILYNKLVLETMKFRFPMFLTMLHSLGVSISLYVASSFFALFTLPSRENGSFSVLRDMIPVSLLFTMATVMRNYAYIYLPIPTIQVINSSAPALCYFFSCVARIDKFSLRMACAISGISAGVCVSAASAIHSTSLSGAALLFAGLVLEATRGVLLKKILNKNACGSPLCLLFLSSTLSCTFLAGPVLATEANDAMNTLQASKEKLLPLLAGNVFFAICLNFASFNFLRTCTVTTTSITALLKDCSLFFISIVASRYGAPASFTSSPISYVGVAGYLLSVVSTFVYIHLRRESANEKQ